jgi:hypothetical protein
MAPQSTAKKTLIENRKEAGLCIDCGEPANGKSRCPKHAAGQKASRQRAADRKKAAGICPNSGCNNPAMPGKIVCERCSKRATKSRLNIYHERKATGKCTNCGEPSDERFCEVCKPGILESQREYHAKRYKEMVAAGRCPQCTEVNDSTTVFCSKCKVDQAENSRIRRLALKLAAFDAYGEQQCSGCNETDIHILEMDHIGGGGNEHRKRIGQGRLYIWLEQNNYPEGFRVLCPTCNKKAHRGIPLPSEK